MKGLFKKKVKYGTYIDRCIKEYGAIISEYNPYYINNTFRLGDDCQLENNRHAWDILNIGDKKKRDEYGKFIK